MPEKEFCLLHEPWILVMRKDGKEEEVSLLDVFQHAPEYQRLAGELPTQDVAVLRLLLAVLHAVFARYDVNGQFAQITSPEDALRRWKSLWDRGSFPMQIMEDYLLHYEERFYLFHPERPFYQVAGLNKAIKYTAAKMNGELSESNNKVRLFSQRTGDGKNTLTYAEAARWLLYVNGFDDVSGSSKGRGENKQPKYKVGWLGRLGLIVAEGKDLFETLLLNLVFLEDGEEKLWGKEKPIWELGTVRSDASCVITIPDNPSELLTLQSRRLLLKRKGDLVTGYLLRGGDFFSEEKAFAEQMTVWRNAAKKEGDPPEYYPKRHDPTRQLWRDFSTLISQGEGKHRPGVISWTAILKRKGLIPDTHCKFMTAAVKYNSTGMMNMSVEDVFSDSLSFNADLLMSLGEDWTMRIIDEIEVADKLVGQVGWLASNLARATGDTDGKNQQNSAREQAYFRLDIPFRQWLEGIDPKKDSMDKSCSGWWEEEKRIIRVLGKELVGQCGPQAYVGRSLMNMKTKKEYRYIAPEVYNQFLYRTATRESLEKGEKKNGRSGKATKKASK